jgi:hypothetical protein
VSRTPRGVRRQPVVRALAAAVSIGASAAALASGPPRLFRSSSLSGRVPKRASSSAASLTVRSAPGCPAVSHAMEDLLNTINSFTKDDSKWCSDWDRVCDLRCVSCRECIPPWRAAGAPPLQIQGLNIRPSTRSAPLAKKHASDEFISLCAKYIPGRKRRLISLADYEFAAILVESGALCIFTSDCVRVFLFWGLRGGWRRFPCCSNEFHELCRPNWSVFRSSHSQLIHRNWWRWNFLSVHFSLLWSRNPPRALLCAAQSSLARTPRAKIPTGVFCRTSIAAVER